MTCHVFGLNIQTKQTRWCIRALAGKPYFVYTHPTRVLNIKTFFLHEFFIDRKREAFSHFPNENSVSFWNDDKFAWRPHCSVLFCAMKISIFSFSVCGRVAELSCALFSEPSAAVGWNQPTIDVVIEAKWREKDFSSLAPSAECCV